MSSYSAVWSVGPKTLDGTFPDTVSFTKSRQYIQITNLSGTEPLIVNAGTSVAAPDDPSGMTTDVAVVPAGQSNVIDMSDEATWATGQTLPVLKIAGDDNEYVVQAVVV